MRLSSAPACVRSWICLCQHLVFVQSAAVHRTNVGVAEHAACCATCPARDGTMPEVVQLLVFFSAQWRQSLPLVATGSLSFACCVSPRKLGLVHAMPAGSACAACLLAVLVLHMPAGSPPGGFGRGSSDLALLEGVSPCMYYVIVSCTCLLAVPASCFLDGCVPFFGPQLAQSVDEGLHSLCASWHLCPTCVCNVQHGNLAGSNRMQTCRALARLVLAALA